MLRGRRRMRRPPLPPPDVQRARTNDKIRVPQILLIDQHQKSLGVVNTDEARSMAAKAELDLVEISPDSRPPVCKIMDYGKFLFEEQKKERVTKQKQAAIDTKEVRLRPATDKGDMEIKAKQARHFLLEGHKVGIQLLFRGREQAHPELAVQKILEFAALFADIAKMEQNPRKEGKRMNALLAPLPQAVKKHQDELAAKGIKKAEPPPGVEDEDDDDFDDDDEDDEVEDGTEAVADGDRG